MDKSVSFSWSNFPQAIAQESFDVQGGFDDVYRIFLVDTPIGAYFEEYLKEADRDKDDMARAGIETSQVGSEIGRRRMIGDWEQGRINIPSGYLT